MERVLTQLVERLTKAYGDRLKSVLLYGSAAVGDYHAKYSDLNVLCVLAEVTPRELEESGPILRWWREKGNPSPLMLSEEEIRNSTDCFPIEFHDIRERHRVLQGEDVVLNLEVDRCFYRAQVEHDLRAKLLRLRQKAAGLLGSDKDQLRELLRIPFHLLYPVPPRVAAPRRKRGLRETPDRRPGARTLRHRYRGVR